MSESDFNCSYDSDSDVMDSIRKRQLLDQIAELQNAVTDMKSAFTSAVQQLSSVQIDDQINSALAEKVEQDKTECQNQVSEVLKLMLTMRADFASLKNQVTSSCEAQQNLQRQVQTLFWERDLLIDELCKSGSISDQIRYRIQNPRQLGRASSGSHSNDSGVVVVVDKGSFPTSFDQNNGVGFNSPHVHDYVVGLEQTRNADFVGDEISTHAYDSDSSLVNVANKSISLSTSLGKQCGLELDSCDVASDDDHSNMESCSVNPVQKNRGNGSNEEISSNDNQRTSVENANEDVENARRLLLTEILETERRYCKALSTLHDMFAVPLKRSGILSSKDINTLFPDEVFQLYGKHCILLHNFEERLHCWGRHGTIGDLFNNFTDPNESSVLQLYTSYVDDFPEVLKTFHKLCRQSSKFARFLKSCLSQPACGGFDLGVFLVTPVQRIPHYVLLLKRMLRLTDESHPDHPWLNGCLERLRDFMDRLNDTMEHSFQLITAQIQLEDEQKPRAQRNIKTRSRQDLCTNSTHDEQTKLNLLQSTRKASSKEFLKDSSKDIFQSQHQEKHSRRLSQSNVRNLLPCVNNKLRTRSRSESLVSSISTTSEELRDHSDWNSNQQHYNHQHQHQQQLQEHRQQQQFYRKKESYYWNDDNEFQCDSGPNSVSTEDDSNNAGGGASILLRHISEDSDTDDDHCNAGQKNIRSSKSMQDVKVHDVDSSSGSYMMDTKPTKCCQHSIATTGGVIGRGVSLACISPTDKRIRAKLMMMIQPETSARRPLDKSQSAHNLIKEQTTMCDCSSLDSSSVKSTSSNKAMTKDQVKKKNFIRTSLKSILLFKKRNTLKANATQSENTSTSPAGIIVEETKTPSKDTANEIEPQQECCFNRRSSTSSRLNHHAVGNCGVVDSVSTINTSPTAPISTHLCRCTNGI